MKVDSDPVVDSRPALQCCCLRRMEKFAQSMLQFAVYARAPSHLKPGLYFHEPHVPGGDG